MYQFHSTTYKTTTWEKAHFLEKNPHLLAATLRRKETWCSLIRWVRDGCCCTIAGLSLLPDFLGAAAVGALVVLYVLRFSRGYPHALAMEPPLADVAADPELACAVYAAAASAKGFAVLFILLLVIVFFWSSSNCPGVLCVNILSSLLKKKGFELGSETGPPVSEFRTNTNYCRVDQPVYLWL
jgi:hypothetical protein